jgi:hypothetical protein
MSKCGKCGEDGHNARSCGRKAKTGGSNRKKGKPKSWVKSLEKKLEAVASDAGQSERPPERSGEPFADLPPLDLPPGEPSDASTATESPTSENADPTATSETASAPSGASTSTEKQVFDTETLQKMAYGIGVGYMKLTSEIAIKGGHMAIGEDMWPIVGMACSVLVKKNAEKFAIDDETGSLYVIGIMGGFNGVQAVRTVIDERKRKEEEQKRERASAAGRAEQQRQQNGVSPELVAEQRKQAAQHANEQRTAGPVV